MKKYNAKFIKDYIEKNRDKIDTVSCGMREDWGWTADTVYENGEFKKGFRWNSSFIEVMGIIGSCWATPVMNITLKNGKTEVVECWLDDGETISEREILEKKMIAKATGGMDYLC